LCLGALVQALAGNTDDVPIVGGNFVMKWVKDIPVPNKPGFAQFPPEFPEQLVLTSFNPAPKIFGGKNAVYMLNFTEGASGEALELPGSTDIDWPNAATGVEASVFGFPALVIGGGFLVPGHSKGGIFVMEASPSPKKLDHPVKITKDIPGSLTEASWFYHFGYLVDMNGDGLQDIVTSRCQFGVLPISHKQGELVWLEQPAAEPLSGKAWKEHTLTPGPDFLFCVHPNSKDAATLALVAPEYLEQKVVYYYMKDGVMQSRVLDEQSGPGFACSWADLNNDGHLDLLVTNHLNQNGSVYAYSFDDDDLVTAKVDRHVLAGNFSAIDTKTGTASPGDAFAFHPKVDAKHEKPHIFLSGDNSNEIFVLVPKSTKTGDWTYTTQKLADVNADVGRPAIADTDHDGFADVYVPAFDRNVLVHYEFSSAASVLVV